MISVKHIDKTYTSGKTVIPALKKVSFEVSPGELFGLIGPDGAGKTTLFRILTTLILPDSGTATVEGFDVVKDYREIRQHVGYMPGHFSLYPDLTVEENLHFFATVFHTSIAENYHLIRDIYGQLEPFKHRRAGKLSGGMKQKLALSCALIHKPSVLFLDEPTTGVDPVSRKELWEILKELRRQGITVLVSTPYMDEAILCDRIMLLRQGRILDIETPPDIIRRFTETLWTVKSNRMSALLGDLRACPGVKSCFAFGDVHHITIDKNRLTMELLKAYLLERQQEEVEIKAIPAGIEDCYMQLAENINV